MSRGWIVAVRKRASVHAYIAWGPWVPAFSGAVFCSKDMAARKADCVRDDINAKVLGLQVRVLRDGLVK